MYAVDKEICDIFFNLIVFYFLIWCVWGKVRKMIKQKNRYNKIFILINVHYILFTFKKV